MFKNIPTLAIAGIWLLFLYIAYLFKLPLGGPRILFGVVWVVSGIAVWYLIQRAYNRD